MRLSVWQVSLWMDRDKLIKEVGGNMNVAHLVREWMPCRERNKMANYYCRAYVVRLGKELHKIQCR